MPDSLSVILALDFGGTKLTAAVVQQGKIAWAAHRRVPSPPDANGPMQVQILFALGRELLAGRAPDAVGASFGGPVDFDAGAVLRSHHVPDWEDMPLRDELGQAFGAPAVVDNDANAGALGEQRYGAGRGCATLLYVTVSTGVGGGLILHGQPYRGAQGLAGEIGHTVVQPGGPLCLCGKRGCVERLASGPYMAADARALLAAQPERAAVLRRMAEDDRAALDARELNRAAAQGDELAMEVLALGARALGVGVGNAANLLNPERVVIGGGVSKSSALWWEAVRESARDTALPEVEFDIVPAALGDDAPLWGAAALAQDLLPL
ncbi:MAG: ROK family protein [Anaerolineales bacterium]